MVRERLKHQRTRRLKPAHELNDNVDVVHQGWTFIGYPFEVELPPESQDRPMIARIRIDNTERLKSFEDTTVVEDMGDLEAAVTARLALISA